jgi:hypothetical protein
MHIPVLIKIGGKIIFFKLVGFFVAFKRTKISIDAIPAAISVLNKNFKLSQPSANY